MPRRPSRLTDHYCSLALRRLQTRLVLNLTKERNYSLVLGEIAQGIAKMLKPEEEPHLLQEHSEDWKLLVNALQLQSLSQREIAVRLLTATIVQYLQAHVPPDPHT